VHGRFWVKENIVLRKYVRRVVMFEGRIKKIYTITRFSYQKYSAEFFNFKPITSICKHYYRERDLTVFFYLNTAQLFVSIDQKQFEKTRVFMAKSVYQSNLIYEISSELCKSTRLEIFLSKMKFPLHLNDPERYEFC
jgi:hypothetical protein